MDTTRADEDVGAADLAVHLCNATRPAPRRLMRGDAIAPYAPLHTLKSVTDDVWIADGPTIRFSLGGEGLCFPTRMTIVRLPSGELFIHCPTELTPELAAEVSRLGPPRYLIGPNRLHYWWLPEWRDAFPDAQAYLAPRLQRHARGRIDFEGRPLDRESGYPWDIALKTLPVAGRFMTEVVFFHRSSRTLLLTDLIENFEPDRVHAWMVRLLIWLGGVRAPDGQMPRDMRLTFPRAELRRAVERMIGWDPERVIIAHGRWFPRNGAAELRRAFRWLLH